MKFILISLTLALASITASAADLELPIRKVVDGDTISTNLKIPCPLCNISVRIIGIDTPESTYLAKCPSELAKGLAAKAFLTNFVIGHPTMTISKLKWDKYGGRIDAVVIINGINVGDEMIRQGFAKPYTGTGPKPDWCS
jgi:endonuclease YncB( thermonuclease family)